jgi:hypothetical protein
LLGDSIGGALFVLTAGGAGGLLDQLPDIVAEDRDSIRPVRQAKDRSASSRLPFSSRPVAEP